MHIPRVKLGSLMLVIVFCAIGLAALTRPSIWWASALYTIDLVFLAAFLVSALLARSPHLRAFSIGFLAFGGLYFLAVFSHLCDGSAAANQLMGHGAPPPPLLTKVLIDFEWGIPSLERYDPGPSGESFQDLSRLPFHFKIGQNWSAATSSTNASDAIVMQVPNSNTNLIPNRYVGSVPPFQIVNIQYSPGAPYSSLQYRRTAHALLVCLIGWLGGQFALRFTRNPPLPFVNPGEDPDPRNMQSQPNAPAEVALSVPAATSLPLPASAEAEPR